jgi:GNAT superfamily N-acetyltransferase
VRLTGADLLSGPRGRRLCLELALMPPSEPSEAAEEFGNAVFCASYELDPGRGTSRVLFGPGADEPTPTPSPAEVARLLDAVPLPRCDEATLLSALAVAVESAMYWQPPSGEDVLAATPEVRSALIRVADAVASAVGAAWWGDPVDRREQWVVTFEDVTGAAPIPEESARKILDRWLPLQLEEEAVAQRERPVDPAASWSGSWWSRPALGLTNTTRALPGHGPMNLEFVEDRLGWEAATVEQVQVPVDSRVFEIDGPAAWAKLVRRYPLDVSAGRRHDWYSVTGRSGSWTIPDWSAVRHDFDAVHLTIGGYLTTAGRAIPVDEERSTVLAGWGPDSTYWLRDLVRDASTRRDWHLDRSDDVWKPTMAMAVVRDYVSGDAATTLDIFLDAVTVTASVDYSPEQIAAWAGPQDREIGAWDSARAECGTVVAILDGDIAGFSDVNADGYIHMLFVAPRFGRRGVASALVAAVEQRARRLGATSLSTNASITARPFFEQHGFVVVAEQRPITRGVSMTNYRMLKQLP